MRKIAATYIFPGDKSPIKNGILVLNDDGSVEDIIDRGVAFKEEAGVEFYSGILVPGFVNAHCHLELSHLHEKIEEKTGIGGFIGKINQLRQHNAEEVEKAIRLADKKMWAAGTAVVGDIANSAVTLQVKCKSKIHYHTFVESFGFHPSRAQKAFEYAGFVLNEFQSKGAEASIVPHSPYSVSHLLFDKIKTKAKREKSILSIHNQESEGESEFYKTGRGSIARHLTANLGIDISHWNPTGISSLQSVLNYFPKENQLLLVHNTFTTEADVDRLQEQRNQENTFWVLCPNSNLYIENKLPPLHLFLQKNCTICLGTDSLASNHSLSVLNEMITLQKAFPELRIEEILTWATINGARALRADKNFGTFEKGKKPGVNLISGIDFKNMKLTEKCKVKRLV